MAFWLIGKMTTYFPMQDIVIMLIYMKEHTGIQGLYGVRKRPLVWGTHIFLITILLADTILREELWNSLAKGSIQNEIFIV